MAQRQPYNNSLHSLAGPSLVASKQDVIALACIVFWWMASVIIRSLFQVIFCYSLLKEINKFKHQVVKFPGQITLIYVVWLYTPFILCKLITSDNFFINLCLLFISSTAFVPLLPVQKSINSCFTSDQLIKIKNSLPFWGKLLFALTIVIYCLTILGLPFSAK